MCRSIFLHKTVSPFKIIIEKFVPFKRMTIFKIVLFQLIMVSYKFQNKFVRTSHLKVFRGSTNIKMYCLVAYDLKNFKKIKNKNFL